MDNRNRVFDLLMAGNSAGAVIGSLVAGFLLLPSIGATRASWLVGLAICGATLLNPSRTRQSIVAAGLAGVLTYGAPGGGPVGIQAEGTLFAPRHVHNIRQEDALRLAPLGGR